jgi:hypothetical protein
MQFDGSNSASLSEFSLANGVHLHAVAQKLPQRRGTDITIAARNNCFANHCQLKTLSYSVLMVTGERLERVVRLMHRLSGMDQA